VRTRRCGLASKLAFPSVLHCSLPAVAARLPRSGVGGAVGVVGLGVSVWFLGVLLVLGDTVVIVWLWMEMSLSEERPVGGPITRCSCLWVLGEWGAWCGVSLTAVFWAVFRVRFGFGVRRDPILRGRGRDDCQGSIRTGLFHYLAFPLTSTSSSHVGIDARVVDLAIRPWRYRPLGGETGLLS